MRCGGCLARFAMMKPFTAAVDRQQHVLPRRARARGPSRRRCPVSRAWFSPSSKRCLRPCTPPVRLFSVYSLHVQPSIRQPTFLQKLQEVEPCEVLGVGVARVRASGSRMLAWITYDGPDGAGALSLEGGALFSFYYTEVRMQGNNRVKLVALLRPMHSINAQQMFV
eukprot:scaffold5747_cov128-Isochrysis_galbana.AAC.7